MKDILKDKKKFTIFVILDFIIFLLILYFILKFVANASEVTDYFKRDIKIPSYPSRIISLSPATTEILCELGLEDRIVGVTLDCNYPPYITKKSKIGKFGFIDMERLITLKPDLIIGTVDMGIKLQELKKLQVPLIALENNNLEQIIENFIILGKLTNTQDKAIKISKNFSDQLKQTKSNNKKVSVYYYLWHEPMITSSNNSFIGDIIQKAGGQNIVTNTLSPYPHYNIETLLKTDPQVIIFPQSVFKQININKKPFNMLKAIKNKNFLLINDDIISRPGPRAFIALKTITEFLNKVK